tara:strand:- start:3622 stop:4353 length:732 start_codon:yes stop_codon:yes gene_type:complete
MDKNYIIIYGGSSLISKELLKILSKDFDRFIIFCRNKNIVENYIHELKLENLEIVIFEADLLDIEKNISFIEKFENNIIGLIWVSGFTGDPNEEYLDSSKCDKNLRINFVNPVLLINKILPKMKSDRKSFLAVITSVAGLRGRSKRLFYSSAKSGMISYLSGLRQKLSKEKINVITVIPGYMNTKPFNIKAPSFLISSPEKSAQIIYNAIKKGKEVVYINFYWKIIMFCINLIPEKIYKKFNF